jgi:hypothetical protein
MLAPSWLPLGPPLDGALAVGSTGAKVADPDVFVVEPEVVVVEPEVFVVEPELFVAGRVVDRVTGLGQTFTRTHFLPRRRRTNLHLGFGFGLA